jgi:hypothetical protein
MEKPLFCTSRGTNNPLLRSLRRYSATSLFGKAHAQAGTHGRGPSPDRPVGGGTGRRHSLAVTAAGTGGGRGHLQPLEDLEEGGEAEVQEQSTGNR